MDIKIIFLILVGIFLGAAEKSELNIVGGHYSDGFVGSDYSYVDSRVYQFGLNDKQANEYSLWMKNLENPPCSPRKALEKAQGMLEKLGLLSDKYFWDLDSIVLRPVSWTLERADGIQLWTYLVIFNRVPNPRPMMSSGVPIQMRIVVLMNGDCIAPVVSDAKK